MLVVAACGEEEAEFEAGGVELPHAAMAEPTSKSDTSMKMKKRCFRFMMWPPGIFSL